MPHVGVPRQCIGTGVGVTRGGLLRGGAVAAAGAVLPAGVARAALPAPAPVGDDAGFLQLAVLAEQVSLACHRALGDRAAARRKATHVAKLVAALGADAPAADDFAIALPQRLTPAVAVRIETLLVRTLTGALAATQDGSTRLLLARLLAADAQQLTVARAAAGLAPVTGLPVPLDLEAAGAELDALLKATNYPTT
jgi:hypothetical protein